MPIALTNSRIIYRQFYAPTASVFIEAVNVTMQATGWTSTAVTGGYRLLGTSPQGKQAYLFIRDKGHQYFDNPFYYPQVTFNFQTIDGAHVGADHDVKIRTDWQYQIVAGKCQIFQSVVGVKTQGGGCSFCGVIPFIPGLTGSDIAGAPPAITVISTSEALKVDPFRALLWKVGSNLYTLLQPSSNSVDMVKSADGGLTWAVVGASSSWSLAYNSSWIDAAQSGNMIYFLATDNSYPNELLIHPFNTNTDAWQDPIMTGGAKSEDNGGTANLISVASDFGGPVIHPSVVGLTWRSDHSAVSVYSWAYRTLGGTYQPIAFQVNTGSGWTSAVTLATSGAHQSLIGTVLGSGDRTHCFFHTSDGKLQHVTITAAGAFQSVQTISAALNKTALQGNSVGQPTAYVSGGVTKIAIPYQNSDGYVRVAIADSADNPTFSSEVVATANTPDTTYINGTRMAVAGDGTGDTKEPVVVWLGNSDQKLYYSKRASGGSWGAAVLIETRTVADGLNVTAADLGNMVGVIYDRFSGFNNVSFYPIDASTICDGEVPAGAPDGSVFWASGDGAGDTGPRGSLIVNNTLGQSEALWGSSYCAPGNAIGSPRLPTLTTAPDIFDGLNLPSPMLWFNGDYFTIEPMLAWGLSNSVLPKVRAQIWDAMIFSKQMPMDARTTRDGYNWVNYTDQYLYGGLNLIVPTADFIEGNYAYIAP